MRQATAILERRVRDMGQVLPLYRSLLEKDSGQAEPERGALRVEGKKSPTGGDESSASSLLRPPASLGMLADSGHHGVGPRDRWKFGQGQVGV